MHLNKNSYPSTEVHLHLQVVIHKETKVVFVVFKKVQAGPGHPSSQGAGEVHTPCLGPHPARTRCG